MNLLLEKDKNDLTKSEQKICNYIEEYMNQSIYMTVNEIATNCGVGEATVTRFCKKLGYRSFLEFKMTMAKEISTTNNSNEVSGNSKVNELKVYVDRCIRNTLDNLNIDHIEEIATKIKEGKKVYVLGFGLSGILAEEMYNKLLHKGVDCLCFRESTMARVVASIAKNEDIVINFSKYNDIKTTIEVVDEIREKRVTIVSITENTVSKLDSISDYIIKYENERLSSLSSNIPAMYVIEMLDYLLG